MSNDELGDPVHARFLRAEIEHLEAEINRVDAVRVAEGRRLDELRMAHIHQDNERQERHQQQHDRLEVTLAGKFEQVNGFRGALADLSSEMATRREVETTTASTHTALETALTGLKAAAENRARQALAIIGLVLTSIIVAVSLYATSHERPIVVQLPTTPTTLTTTAPAGG